MTTAAPPAPALPIQLTSFIGREAEIAAVREALRQARLLTLTGAGGAGKTRLAAAVTAAVTPDFEVVGWVDLAPLAEPALVAPVVAATLGYREEGGRSAVETMVNRLCERVTLVVLDNCEHLVDACAALAESLLKGCPRVRVLATSREALGIAGEQAWLVPPLPAADGARLFVERARAVQPAFALTESGAAAVAQICQRLDGIPLAIELAAARARVLAPEQIAARLDDAFKLLAAPGRSPARHRTLREAIDWSHALLDPPEAALFRQLAVFPGSFSLDAVEAVCPEDGVLDVLASLVDKSLVVMETAANEARYRLLETLRQYAHEKLADAGELDAARRRHAAFFTELVTSRERDTFGGAGEPEWTRRLTAEEGNLRAAIDWAQDADDPATALRLCAAVHWHWFARGHFAEGWQRLRTALAHADRVPPLVAGKAHAAAATIAFWRGAFAEIGPHAERAAALLRDQGDGFHLAYALVSLGQATADPAQADATLDEATALARAQGPRTVLLAFALYWQGRLALSRGQLDQAERLLTEAYAVGRALAHLPAIAHSLAMLGMAKVQRGQHAPAADDLREALRMHADNGDLLGCIWSLEGLARLAHLAGRPDRAAEFLAAARGERDRLGSPWSPRERQELEPLATAVAPGRAVTLADAITRALASGPAFATPVPPPPTPRPSTTPVLAVRALGALRVTRNGETLERSAWTAAKPRELLLLLLCHPEGRTREQIGLAFWPDASAQQVRNNFHVTLHRLRKTLGDTRWVVLAGDRYRLDPRAQVEFDAAAFERDVTAATTQARRDPRGGEAALAAALARYGGDFLEHEVVGDWHLELRDRLRQKYLDGWTLLAGIRMAGQRWADAAEAWRTLLGRDQLDERAARGLMTCHARLGERSQARQVFERLERALKKELDAAPAAETRQLLRELLA